MKRRGTVVILAVCAVLLIAILAGCGGTGGSSATTAGGGGSGSTATTAGASAGTLDQYKKDMKAWGDKYDADLSKKADALGEITDRLNATDDQVKSAKDFADLVKKATDDLKKIQPPAELATDHNAYVDGLTTMAGGFQKYAEAVEKGDAALLAEALGPMAATAQVAEAEANLEKALGIQLTSD